MTDDDATARTTWNDGDRAVLVGVGAWALALVALALPTPEWFSWLGLPLFGFAAAAYRHLAGVVTALAFVVWLAVGSLLVIGSDPQAALGIVWGFIFGAFVLAGVALRMLVDWMAGRRARFGSSPRGSVVLLGVLLVVVGGALADAITGLGSSS